MRRSLRILVVAASLTVLWPVPARGGEVSLTIRDGLVTLVARDASVRQILQEWARVGRTRIVNVERVPGGPLSIELVNVPEARALGIILRPIGGFMAAPRTAANGQFSRFDRIVVMPVLASVASLTPAAPVSQRPSGFGPTGSPGGGSPFSIGRRPGARVGGDNPNETGDPGDSNDEDVEDEPREPALDRPQVVRPGMPVGTQNDDASGAESGTSPGRPPVPGMSTPGGSVTRPGQIVPAPPKPPGDTR